MLRITPRALADLPCLPVHVIKLQLVTRTYLVQTSMLKIVSHTHA